MLFLLKQCRTVGKIACISEANAGARQHMHSYCKVFLSLRERHSLVQISWFCNQHLWKQQFSVIIYGVKIKKAIYIIFKLQDSGVCRYARMVNAKVLVVYHSDIRYSSLHITQRSCKRKVLGWIIQVRKKKMTTIMQNSIQKRIWK